ncbi:hypothetical protein E3Z27_00345 [Pseudomonas mediterranea]|uniref:hypothetical protein n=1 Tax=Pseudomonas mediterranea TaxID=183795 RepID=UPI001318FAB9|nr:hypothetical protein [Pseudomonas mediterranea]QHA80238.1 hypothetical protein E3Z27_00345 [Pseudomonas mediterranea]CAH0265911.1 hypothetical protein SRABI112_03500 [Pseudomonas mediterranea]
MKKLKTYLTAFALALGGMATHANAAGEHNRGNSGGLCYQLTPLKKTPSPRAVGL